jgi:hypothetical protein
MFRRVFDLSPGQYREEVNAGRVRQPAARSRTMRGPTWAKRLGSETRRH